MRCPRCRHQNPDHHRYCSRCGTLLHPLAGEKRFASVVFFDLSDYTLFLNREGPDRAWQEASKAFNAAAEIVAEEGGEVHNTYGDGLIAVFGFQQSRGGEVERAVRAAARIVARVEQMRRKGGIGLHGRAVVTSGFLLLMPTSDQKLDFYGSPLNEAERLIKATPPGMVYLDATTRDLVRGVRTEPVPPLRAKGYAKPLVAYRFVGFSAPEPAARVAELLSELEAEWTAVTQGEGRTAVVVGPPGVGKRLTLEAFLARVDPKRIVRTPPLGEGTPIRAWLRRLFAENPQLAADVRGLALEPEERRVLEMAFGMRPGRVAPSRALRVVRRALLALIQEPMVVVIEGLHRAPALLLRFIESWNGAKAPLLLLGTARSGSYPRTFTLGALPFEEAVAWLAARAPSQGPRTLERAARLADGLPGLMLRLLPEPTEERLAALLQPYLDALGEAREVVLLAAQLPEPVPVRWLEAVLGHRVGPAVRRAVAEGFLELDEEGVRFASRAYRRAAAALVSETRSRGWKRALAEALLSEGDPELAAQLYNEAGLAGAAIRVLRALAHDKEDEEAIPLLERAKVIATHPRQAEPVRIELAERHLPQDPERALRELTGVQHPAADRVRGLALAALGRRREAARALLRHLERRGEDLPVWQKLIETAPPDLLEGLKPPPDAALRLRLAQRCELEGLGPCAEAHYRELLTADGDEGAAAAASVAGLLWRDFKAAEAWALIRRAEALARSPETQALIETLAGGFLLEGGKLEPGRRRIERALSLLAPSACHETYARAAGAEIRALLYQGELKRALARAEEHSRRCPHPWVVALWTLTFALSGEPHEARWRAGSELGRHPDPHAETIFHLSSGFAQLTLGGDPRPDYEKALSSARRAQNPYLETFVQVFWGFYLREKAPEGLLPLGERILERVPCEDYQPLCHAGRLFVAEAHQAQGRRQRELLDFESPFALLEFWRRSLLAAWGEDVEPLAPEAVQRYGLLGRALLADWEWVWIRGKRSVRESA